MSASKSFGDMHAAKQHLVQGTGGLSGEINDLRNDVEVGFGRMETPGHGGTNILAVEEFTNVPASDDDWYLAATAAGATATTVTTFLHSSVAIPRNISIDMTAAGTLADPPNVTVNGTDVNGAAISEDFVVANAIVAGNKAFKTVTSVVVPALVAVKLTALSIKVGTGLKIGLGSKVKVRNTIANIIAEMMDGGFITGGGVGAVTATNQAATATNQNATATNAAKKMPGVVSFTAPATPDLVSVVADVLMADGALVIAAQPDYPRKLRVNITDDDASVSAGKVTLVGRSADGEGVTEEIALTGGSNTVVTTNVYATLTSATISDLAGNGAGDNIGIGVSGALGLPVPTGATAIQVLKTIVDGVHEANGTVDNVVGSVAPTTPPNNTHNYDIWFTYELAVTQNAHTHVQDAHTHAGSAGTFATPAVGAPNGTYTPVTAPNGAHDYVVCYERDLT